MEWFHVLGIGPKSRAEVPAQKEFPKAPGIFDRSKVVI